jgi:surface antigen
MTPHLGPALRASVALALSIGAAGIGPAGAEAGPPPFPVGLSVTAASKGDRNEVTVVARTVSHTRCALEVTGRRIVKRFPSALTDQGGVIGWRWSSAGIGSHALWKFTATCTRGAELSRRWMSAELGFPTAGGALVRSTSSAVDAPGSSCDLQGVCFAEDPFPIGQCTWYAAGRRPDLRGIVHGNAGTWLEDARGRVPEGWSPIVGALAVWRPHQDGTGEDGHVAYVAAVSEEGKILIDDSNWTPTPTSPGLQVHEHWVPLDLPPSGYIYGGPAGAGPRM